MVAFAGLARQVANLRFKDLSVREFVKHLTPVVVEEHDQAVTLEAQSNMDFGWGRLFGGQPMGQALAAASATVPPHQNANSFSCKFLREGYLDSAVRFQVEKVRDGRSFATRRVRAFQPHGDILDMLVSFHVQEDGFDHQLRRPSVGAKGSCPVGPNRQRLELFAEQRGRTLDQIMPKVLQDVFLDETQPVLLRPRTLIDVSGYDETMPPEQGNWLRANDDYVQAVAEAARGDQATGRPPLTEVQVSQSMLAFSSDFSFLGTSLLPHGKSVWNPSIQPATLSHTMFFHRPVCLSSWHLFEMESPSASNARGFVRGEIFDCASGDLVASAMQEGLIRPRKFKPKANKVSPFS